MYTYYHASRAIGLGLFFTVIGLGGLALSLSIIITQGGILTGFWFGAVGIGSGWIVLKLGLSALFTNPTLTIGDEGIRVNGYWPAGNTNNWPRELPWSEIGRAKIESKETAIKGPMSTSKTKTVSLVFYGLNVPEKVVGTVADFEKYQKSDEITKFINHRLAQPVAQETVQEVRSLK